MPFTRKSLSNGLFQFSSLKMTVFVRTKDHLVFSTSPITKMFKGQNVNNLIDWMKQQGGFKITRLTNDA